MTTQPEQSIREPLESPTPIVPAFLSPLEPMPEPARRIPFWKAFCFYPVRPNWGPHLAASSMPRAFAAHFLAMGVAILLGMTTYVFATSKVAGILGMRIQLANMVRDGIIWSDQTQDSDISALLILGSPFALTLSLVVIAFIAASAIDAGDGFASASRRSINDALWMTTILPWIAGLALVLFSIQKFMNARIAHTGILSWTELMIHNNTLLAILCIVALALGVRLTRSGVSRYVGPAIGPGFRQRRPRCEDCGYLIGGLPLDSRCPECGHAVSASLPTGQRASLKPLDKRLSIAHPVVYWRFWKRMLTNRTAMRDLPMTDFAAARRFWWVGYFNGFIAFMFILIALRQIADLLNNGPAIAMSAMAMVAITAAPILQVFAVFVAMLIGSVQYGIQDTRVCQTVAHYAAVMFGPLAVLIVLQVLVTLIRPLRQATFSLFGGTIEWIAVPTTAISVLAIGCLVLWLRRCIAGLQSAAYANS